MRISTRTRMAQQVVMIEIQRGEIEHFLQTDQIRIRLCKHGTGKPSIRKVECGRVWRAVFRHIIVTRAIEPRVTCRVAQAQVLHVEGDDPHLLGMCLRLVVSQAQSKTGGRMTISKHQIWQKPIE